MYQIQCILNHFDELWANGDSVVYRYILSWIRYIFKHTDTKTKTVMVKSYKHQGTGKSIVMEQSMIPFIFEKSLSLAASFRDISTHIS
jgi:hypothetical protein